MLQLCAITMLEINFIINHFEILKTIIIDWQNGNGRQLRY